MMIVVASTLLVSAATLAEVLEHSGGYVADYQERLSSVVAEETYEQQVESKSSGTCRRSTYPSRNRTSYELSLLPGSSDIA